VNLPTPERLGTCVGVDIGFTAAAAVATGVVTSIMVVNFAAADWLRGAELASVVQ
jgi:hypothetical protein